MNAQELTATKQGKTAGPVRSKPGISDIKRFETAERPPGQTATGENWKILIADDDPNVHATMRLALDDIVIEGRELELFFAGSAAEALEIMADNPDTVLALLDVVMESEQSGLELVRRIREELHNQLIQLVIVTGQPAYAPERDVVEHYQINDYRLKTDLSAQKLTTLVYSAIRSYRALSELSDSRQEIEHMAYYDSLTGLPNRALLKDRLSQAVAQHRRTGLKLAVCFLDLDHFKPVNDRYGHNVGDKLLKAVGQRLLAIVREGDTVSHLGGDEFVILLTGLHSAGEAEHTLGRLLKTVGAPFEVADNSIRISGSIGATVFPEDAVDSEILIRHADYAMYQAKAAGKSNYAFYDPKQEQQAEQFRHLRSQIVTGLRKGQFVLHFQPRIELRTGKVVSAEALLRWQHPDCRLRLPGEFLPSVHGSKEEIALGDWVINAGLRQLAEWKKEGLNLPISINISPEHFQSSEFSEYLKRLMTEYPEVESDHLEFEMLETSAVGDLDHVSEEIAKCKKLGVHFSLDDFGTGFSSLTYFHRLPIDILKIDQKFVHSIFDEARNIDIIEGVLRLAESLDRPVVAEGVESIDLGLLLLVKGCQYGQGYGIARPMPADDFAEWLGEWNDQNPWKQLDERASAVDGDIKTAAAVLAHNRWLDQLIECLAAWEDLPFPMLDEKVCVFAQWYEDVGSVSYAKDPVLHDIEGIHHHLYELGEKLMDLRNDGRRAEAQAGLDELKSLSDEFLAKLTQLSSGVMAPKA